MSDEERLAVVDRNPSERPKACVIWLHGLGADGHDFEPVVDTLRLPPAAAVRFVFPHAPVRAVTVNAGMRMRAWYDVRSLDLTEREDAEGIRDSAAQIHRLIDAELDGGLAAGSIILGGFSQGGAVALHAGLRYRWRLGGVFALSSYLPLADRLPAEASPANAELELFMGHGREDTVIPIAHARAAAKRLQGNGYPLDWHEYEAPHTVTEAELADLRAWLTARLGAGSGETRTG